MKRLAIASVVAFLLTAIPAAPGEDVEFQPFAAQATRVVEAMEFLGSPVSPDDRKAIEAAAKETDPAKGVAEIQRVLDKYCLLAVGINPESRVKVARGAAEPELVEGGWRTFLVRVNNEAGVTAPLAIASPNAKPLHNSPKEDVAHRWLEIRPHTKQPMQEKLSGLAVEYRVVSLYSRDAGKREAKLQCDVGQGTQDLGFRGEQDVLFTAKPAADVTLTIRDERDEPTTGSFVFRDAAGRVYPSQAKRLAPDFSFQQQVYRRDGQTVKLPPGKYSVEFGRGPEYVVQRREIEVPANAEKGRASFALKRWVDPAARGWFSGDHHIHAAGCAHYTNPTEGVHADDMLLHIQGEDLKVGCNLTWGPCFDYQKQFFTGKIDKVSQFPYLLRYDIEVSGFGSHRSGHLVLLRLKEQMYPGGDSSKHWPTLGLNTLRWAKKQGAVTGPAHSGNGLNVRTTELPNYEIPPYNGIGANEFVVDITHEVEGPGGKPVPAIDFISLCDTHSVSELNMWYHALNCGYRVRGSGETDFPCITGERVGMGRSYVKPEGGKLEFDAWCEGIRQGRSYASDGLSHLMDFKVNDQGVGEKGSELKLAEPATVRVTASVAALLAEQPNDSIRKKPLGAFPTWHVERARVGETREVPVEVVVNGRAVARKNVPADGSLRDVSFDVKLDRSSWVALRIYPSSHTNPVFVLVGDKPIRASRRSAQWCLDGVDKCWQEKKRFYQGAEQAEAEEAYAHARDAYRRILAEAEVD